MQNFISYLPTIPRKTHSLAILTLFITMSTLSWSSVIASASNEEGIKLCKNFGATKADGQVIVFHEKRNWTGLFNYICLNHLCYPGENIGRFYQRTFGLSPYPSHQKLHLKFMVQDNLLGQYIAEKHITTPVSDCLLPE